MVWGHRPLVVTPARPYFSGSKVYTDFFVRTRSKLFTKNTVYLNLIEIKSYVIARLTVLTNLNAMGYYEITVGQCTVFCVWWPYLSVNISESTVSTDKMFETGKRVRGLLEKFKLISSDITDPEIGN